MKEVYRKDLLTKVAYVGGTGLIACGGIIFARNIGRDGIYLATYGVIIDALGLFHDRWCYRQYEKRKRKEDA